MPQPLGYSVNLPELRGQMGRAALNQKKLAALAGLHYMTLKRILRLGRADLPTLAAITEALNQALPLEKQPQIDILTLLDSEGYSVPTAGALAHISQRAHATRGQRRSVGRPSQRLPLPEPDVLMPERNDP